MPFGPGTFYWSPEAGRDVPEGSAPSAVAGEDEPEHVREWAESKSRRERDEDRMLRKLGCQYEKNANQLSRMEMIWVQWYMLERAPASSLGCSSALHAGPGQLAFGSDRRQKADLTVVEKPGSIRVLNFHGGYYHYKGHQPCCELGQDTFDAERSRSSAEMLSARHESYEQDARTEEGDELKRGLARALTSVGKLEFSYETMTECEVFHGRYKVKSKDLSSRHGDSYLAPPPFKAICPDALVKLLVEGRVQGFVTISGGETQRCDKVGQLFSFCQQSACPKWEEFSEFTKQQIKESVGHDRLAEERLVKRLTSTPLNMVKSYFETDGPGHTMWSEQFCWLVRKRKLCNFKVVHFVHYNARPWFKPFLDKNLQARWRLKSDPMRKLDCQILKLLNNGFYGYNSIQATSETDRNEGQADPLPGLQG